MYVELTIHFNITIRSLLFADNPISISYLIRDLRVSITGASTGNEGTVTGLCNCTMPPTKLQIIILFYESFEHTPGFAPPPSYVPDACPSLHYAPTIPRPRLKYQLPGCLLSSPASQSTNDDLLS